jgi:hypothetical protein
MSASSAIWRFSWSSALSRPVSAELRKNWAMTKTISTKMMTMSNVLSTST